METKEVNLKNYAHIGDAVWELFIREFTVYKTQKAKELHALTTQHVRADYQAKMLLLLQEHLSETETELVRRAGNLSIPVARRNMQNEYRKATAFEALIGWCYLNDKIRLEKLLEIVKQSDLFLLW